MNLNTYRTSPLGNCTLINFEEICRDRIHLYAILENAKLLQFEEGSKNWSNFIISNIKQLELKTYRTLLDYDLQQGFFGSKRIDNLAHWAVGLSYCQSKELQKLFINWELQWFHLLFMNSNKRDREAFLSKNNLMCDTLEVLEKILFDDDIIDATEISKNDYNSTIFYKSKYYEIPEVVGRREALINGGIAIFSENNYICYLKNKLKYEFVERLEFQNKVYPSLKDQFKFLINRVPQYIPNINFGIEVDNITLENIDYFANRHFPLCMKHLHNTLRKEHHLKYDGRMQYGVFLYWLGLSFENAMEFWKDEFVQKMSEDFFERKHAYLFKHQYGQVGRKSPYNPWSCDKILMYTPLTKQHHGCPFKHWSKVTLLQSVEKEVSCLKDIEDLVDRQQFQKACTSYFCKSRNVLKLNDELDVIKSPNQYVNESFLARDILDLVFDN